ADLLPCDLQAHTVNGDRGRIRLGDRVNARCADYGKDSLTTLCDSVLIGPYIMNSQQVEEIGVCRRRDSLDRRGSPRSTRRYGKLLVVGVKAHRHMLDV